ncbi:MAG: response regulator transcription factor [Bacteroidota bacterium]|nr:response regulator transcription factor [Bacteroidota bacterium]MDP4192841.1 response regulator transcription factor [Bacteroidota bacterium]MDP4197505.1 response regulator transcription factor [Bacteroidota bacterium]
MRILIIEDDVKISSSLSKGLKQESFAIDQAFDGLEGERLAKTNDYDAIILDVRLPLQDGFKTCMNLRNEKILTPILMLTALDDVSDKIKGLDNGADDYLAKPFHFGELLARLRSLIRRNTIERSTVLNKYGVQLDQNTHKAVRENKEITLTAKEYSLLELFMLHPGRILSREMISEHLWDMNFDPKSNIIESYVKFLRQKIDYGFSRQLIHTVRGAGYMFSERLE